MEFADYLAIVRRSLGLIALIVVVATGLTAVMTARQPTRTEGSLTATVFQVVPAQTTATTPYQFDSFYTLQGASLYADQLKAMSVDPAFVASVFAQAHALVPAHRLVQLGRLLTVKKQDPATIQLIFDDSDAPKVVAVLAAAGQQLQDATARLQASGAVTNVRLEIAPAYTMTYHQSVLLSSVIALVASIVLALSLVFILEFARPQGR